MWNCIADDVRRNLVDMALERPELSPHEMAGAERIKLSDAREFVADEVNLDDYGGLLLTSCSGFPSWTAVAILHG